MATLGNFKVSSWCVSNKLKLFCDSAIKKIPFLSVKIKRGKL